MSKIRDALGTLADAVEETVGAAVGAVVEEATTVIKEVTEEIADAVEKAQKYQPTEADTLLQEWHNLVTQDHPNQPRPAMEIAMIETVGEYLDPITNDDGTFE